MFDFHRGAKVTGRKFYFVSGSDAMREWGLMSKMMAFHHARGWKMIIPPYLVNESTAEMAGIFPRFKDQFYRTTDGLILIPTAETPMVGYHSNEILNEADLPLKYFAVSPCFRREAGAAGKRDAGLHRVHQFHKVELFEICKPEQSYHEHDQMLNHITDMIDALWPGLNWRTVVLPENERSPVSCKTIDIEIACGDEWLEVSSVSNTEDRQSRPAKVRYRAGNGKPIRCHMLNGSALALPRLTLALDKLKEENGKI